MTTNAIAPLIEYVENGSTLTHPIPFKFLATSDLRVSRIAAGVETVLAYGADFTATGAGATDGGTLTKVNGGTAGTVLRIRRVTARIQSAHYTTNDTFPAEVHEAALDRAMFCLQENDASIDDLTSRTVRVPAGRAAPALDLAALAGGAIGVAADALSFVKLVIVGGAFDLLASLALATGSVLVGTVQSVAAGAYGVLRSVADKLSDHLDVRDFTGADPTGVADSTTAFKRAIAEAKATGRPLRISRGQWLLSDTILSGAYIEKIMIFGDGRKSTEILNHCVGKPLIDAGNTYWLELRDLCITGNGLTGASGNGHAISMISPNVIGTVTFLPGHSTLRRLRVSQHKGQDVAYLGGAMPACGLYNAGSLGLVVDHCFFDENQFGAYNVQAAQTTFKIPTFYNNKLDALVNEQCENLRVIRPDIVGDHGVGAVAAVTGADGKVRVGNYGIQSTGGTLVKAGAVVDFFGLGSEYIGGKLKNHLYAAFSLYSPHQPLVQGPYMRQDVDGACGVFNAFGARVVSPTFALGNPASGSITTRYGYWAQPQNGYGDIGVLRDARFTNGGADIYGIAAFVDSSLAGGAAISGVIDGCALGDAGGSGAASTWTAMIRVTGTVAGLAVCNNRAIVGPNVTITTIYDFTGVATANEGLVFDNNSYLVTGGTVTAASVLPTDYTGLQRNGYYNVVRVTVRGVQVLAGRDTGWSAGSGTPSKAAFAAYAGATMSAGYVQAEAQATNNAVKAASQRLLAIEQALTTHGLIGA